MKRLLVNADDFGICRGVTDGIVEAHRRGIVTSTSIMAGGAAFDHAVAQAKRQPALGVGVHLTLVEELPVCDPSLISTLIDGTGRLPRTWKELAAGMSLGRVRIGHIETELRAQIVKCFGAGLRPTHLDSHQHVHALPPILQVVLKLAHEFGIRGLRVPADSPTRAGASHCDGYWPKVALCGLAALGRGAVSRAGLKTCARMTGLFESGSLDERRLIRILEGLPEGTTELVCHPGAEDRECGQTYQHWGYHWETEFAALTSPAVAEVIRKQGIRLIQYDDL